MSTGYQISVKNQCGENWEAMQPSQSGKYCSNCCRQVTDFTKLSSAEIIELIKSSKDKICGRFADEQLDFFSSPQIEKSNIFQRILAGLTLLAVTTTVNAKGKLINYHSNIENTLQTDFNKLTSRKNVSDSFHIVKGKITDNESRPVVAATVEIKSIKISTSTNDAGEFSISIPDSMLKSKITLTFLAVGYNAQTLTLSKEQVLNPIDCTMFRMENATMGEVVVVKVRKKRWWKFWK